MNTNELDLFVNLTAKLYIDYIQYSKSDGVLSNLINPENALKTVEDIIQYTGEMSLESHEETWLKLRKEYHNLQVKMTKENISVIETTDDEFFEVKYGFAPLTEETDRELIKIITQKPSTKFGLESATRELQEQNKFMAELIFRLLKTRK